jgi:type VI secretion system lysozyme-like protein
MSFLNRFMDDPPRDTLLESVVRNLNYLLAARRHYGSALHDYGLADYYSQLSSRNVSQSVMREILQTIAEHEPRLAVRDLVALGRDAELRLQLLLRGFVEGRRCVLHLAFDMVSGALAVVDARELPKGEER